MDEGRDRFTSPYFFEAGFFAVAFFAAGFFAAVFFVPDAAFAPSVEAFFAPPRPRAALAASFFSRPGQSMFGQSFQGPRAVVTTTIGTPQSGHSS